MLVAQLDGLGTGERHSDFVSRAEIYGLGPGHATLAQLTPDVVEERQRILAAGRCFHLRLTAAGGLTRGRSGRVEAGLFIGFLLAVAGGPLKLYGAEIGRRFGVIAVGNREARDRGVEIELQVQPRCDVCRAFVPRGFQLRLAQTQPARPIDAVAQLFVFKGGRTQGSSGTCECRAGQHQTHYFSERILRHG